MSEPIETTGEITIDGELIETANLVFHPLPKGECCRTQHENTKREVIKILDLKRYWISKQRNIEVWDLLTEIMEEVKDIKLEDTK